MIFIKEKSMKNLFELSEEEKNQIRGLHESYKSKPGTSLNEQGARISGVKMTDKGKFDISRTKTKETDAITGKEGVGQEDYFTDKDNTEVLGYYNNPKSEWKSLITAYIWNKIKFWDLSSKKAYKKIMTDSPYIMFNVVAEIGRKDGDSTAIKSQRVVIEDLGEKTTTTPAKEAAPTIIYPGFSAPPAAGNTSDFFADNSWAPTESMKTYVQTNLVEPILDIINVAKSKTNTTPVLFLSKLNVDSSVSRFLNSIDNQGTKIPPGENPDRMSFETLSNKRADAAIQYLKEVLSPYVNWDDTIVTKNTKGGNGDGSTGPDPYKEADSIIKNTDPNNKLKSYQSVFDSPGFRKKYEPNKFTKFDIVVGVVPIPGKTEEPEPTPGTVKTEKNFKFLFFYEDTDWNFDFNLPKFDWKYTSSGKAPGFWKISENVCEQKWWQRIFKKYIIPKDF
jgi:hypothetical protein